MNSITETMNIVLDNYEDETQYKCELLYRACDMIPRELFGLNPDADIFQYLLDLEVHEPTDVIIEDMFHRNYIAIYDEDIDYEDPNLTPLSHEHIPEEDVKETSKIILEWAEEKKLLK